MICRACYREIPPGGIFCPHCGGRVAEAVPAQVSAVATEPEMGGWSNPWEQRGGRGSVSAFAETLQQSLFHPVAFFRRTAPDRGAGAALLYAVITGTLSIAVFCLWQRVLGDQTPFDCGGRYLSFFEGPVMLALILIVTPIAIALTSLVSAAVQHVTLAVLGGATGTYATTLKAICYSSSGMVFNVFPLCGTAIGAVWGVVLQVIGLRELHRTSTARAVFAWLLPFVIATCLAGAVFLAAMLGLVKLLMHFGDGNFAA